MSLFPHPKKRGKRKKERESAQWKRARGSDLLSICVWSLPFSIFREPLGDQVLSVSSTAAVSTGASLLLQHPQRSLIHINTCTHKCQTQTKLLPITPLGPCWALPELSHVSLRCYSMLHSRWRHEGQAYDVNSTCFSQGATKMTGWHVCSTQLKNSLLIFIVCSVFSRRKKKSVSNIGISTCILFNLSFHSFDGNEETMAAFV